MHTRDLSVKRRRRRRVSGMTLVEIMVVIVIMAMIATAVGVAVIPQAVEARNRQARIDATSVRTAAGIWLVGHGSRQCPTVALLVEDGVLSSQQSTRDPWDNEFEIICDGPEPEVHSAGADGTFGTEDDI